MFFGSPLELTGKKGVATPKRTVHPQLYAIPWLLLIPLQKLNFLRVQWKLLLSRKDPFPTGNPDSECRPKGKPNAFCRGPNSHLRAGQRSRAARAHCLTGITRFALPPASQGQRKWRNACIEAAMEVEENKETRNSLPTRHRQHWAVCLMIPYSKFNLWVK